VRSRSRRRRHPSPSSNSNASRNANERTVDQRLQAAPPAPVARIPETEAPCFRIDRVLLVGERAEAFQWAVADLSGPDGNDSPLGRCLGTAGVNVVLARAQQAAIARAALSPPACWLRRRIYPPAP
jgi:hemolysin activation/secretion protein